MTSHVDRFYAAVSILAGDGHIKQRLIKAFQDNLADVDEDELPVSIKEPFSDLRQKLNSVSPHNGESPVCASVRKMSATEASICAAELVTLFGEVLQHADSMQYPPAAENDTATPVPPFLVKTV